MHPFIIIRKILVGVIFNLIHPLYKIAHVDKYKYLVVKVTSLGDGNLEAAGKIRQKSETEAT